MGRNISVFFLHGCRDYSSGEGDETSDLHMLRSHYSILRWLSAPYVHALLRHVWGSSRCQIFWLFFNRNKVLRMLKSNLSDPSFSASPLSRETAIHSARI